MVLKADQQRVKALLTETVTLLCKNGLHFKTELCIEGLIGITLDQEEIFLVNIKETVKLNNSVNETESEKSPAPSEQQRTVKRSCQRNIPLEITPVITSDATLPSLGPLSITTADAPFVTLNPDNNSGCDLLPYSPVQSGLVKNQSEDTVVSTRSLTPQPSSTKASETVSSERALSFCDVPIKLDFELGSHDSVANTVQTSEHRLSGGEPSCKRPRRQSPNQLKENQQSHEQSSLEPAAYELPPPHSSSSCKLEPSEIIEIKEESLSGDEMTDSMAGYPSYADYSSTAVFGGRDLDMNQMYGEPSGLQSETMYHGDLQGNISARSHEHPAGKGLPKRLPKTVVRSSYMHLLDKPVRCSECGVHFKTETNVRRHMRLVHWRQYKNVCPFCGKGTKTKADLVGHMATKHNVPKEFQCPICRKEFAYKNGMKTHVREQHGVTTLLLQE